MVPTKQTSFVFIGEEAGNKAQKAEEYHLQTYSNREEIVKSFPPLGELQLHVKPKPIVHTIKQEGLF
ncbi:MAG: hypothetical protein LBD11_00595 [Candidatus Peribacteria bacterium]|jgi:hypothetical protein|nr:hypothetical protein [Candidatus Peribacteria bacterium]